MTENKDFSAWFNVREYADLVVKCGQPGSEIKIYCHKVILCSRSHFFRAKCGALSTRALTAGQRVEVTVPPFSDGKIHDSKAVKAVLQTSYKPASETEPWLEQHTILDLLSIFDATWTLGPSALRKTARSVISRRLRARNRSLATVRGIIAVSEHVKDFLSLREHFSSEMKILHQKRDFEDQKRTMLLLRDPGTRDTVPEEEYRSFLSAVWNSHQADHKQVLENLGQDAERSICTEFEQADEGAGGAAK